MENTRQLDHEDSNPVAEPPWLYQKGELQEIKWIISAFYLTGVLCKKKKKKNIERKNIYIAFYV